MTKEELDFIERQWVEYNAVYVKNIGSSPEANIVLKELNGALQLFSYLTGHSPTQADHLIFEGLYPAMVKLSFSEKEELINLSRWYQNMQHIHENPHGMILFSRSTLYS